MNEITKCSVCKKSFERDMERPEGKLISCPQCSFGEVETVAWPCLNCGKVSYYPTNSNTGMGIFNAFCSDTNCEDEYAFKTIQGLK